MTALRRRLDGEAGTSLLEVMVTLALLGVAVALASSALLGMSRVTQDADVRTRATQQARRVLEVVARDIRAAEPIVAIDPARPVAAYDTELGVELTCPELLACDGGRQTVRYRVTGGRLERDAGTGAAVLLGHTAGAAVLNPATEPVFRYLDASGRPVPTSGSAAPPAAFFRDCVREVVITLDVASTPAAASSRISTTVSLRNHEVVDGC